MANILNLDRYKAGLERKLSELNNRIRRSHSLSPKDRDAIKKEAANVQKQLDKYELALKHPPVYR